jgi:hypothetical protein
MLSYGVVLTTLAFEAGTPGFNPRRVFSGFSLGSVFAEKIEFS